MKKHIPIILSVSVLVLFIRANGCSEGENEQRTSHRVILTTEEQLTTSVGSKDLSAFTLQTMNEQAILKFSDAMDYLRLTQDTMIDESIRGEAATAFHESFASDSCSLDFPGEVTGLIRNVLPTANRTGNQKLFFIVPEIDTCRIIQPLQKTADLVYSGKILVRFKSAHNRRQNTSATGNLERTLAFYASQRPKNIGGKNYENWTLSLGSLK